MIGDTMIIEETATGYNATGIDHESREFRMLNEATQKNLETQEAEKAALQAQIDREQRIRHKRMALEALAKKRREKAAMKLAGRCAAWFTGTAAMAAMAYIKAMAWWLTTMIALVWFGVIAFRIGQYTKEVL